MVVVLMVGRSWWGWEGNGRVVEQRGREGARLHECAVGGGR